MRSTDLGSFISGNRFILRLITRGSTRSGDLIHTAPDDDPEAEPVAMRISGREAKAVLIGVGLREAGVWRVAATSSLRSPGKRGEPVAGGRTMIDMLSPTTAVLLIAHGSRHAPANDDLHQLVARLAAKGDHVIVEPAFLELAEPDIPSGGDRCVARGADRVLMVPYFLSEGVHLTRDLTAARQALEDRHPGVDFRLGPPLGPDPLLDQLVADRIRLTELAVDRPAATG